MRLLRDWTLGSRFSLGLLMLAVSSAVATAAGAIHLGTLPEASPSPAPVDAYPQRARRVRSQDALLLQAVHRNPMRPDRRRADGRYGQANEPRLDEVVQHEPVPAFRVVGVVRRTGRSDMAALSFDDQPPVLVHQGDRLLGFRLDRVGRDSVYLSRPDTAIGVVLPGPRQSAGAD